MAETPNEILEQIEAKRDRLGQNIDELESYVRDKADVKVHFNRKPWAFVGGAAVAGLLLSKILMPSRPRQTRSEQRFR